MPKPEENREWDSDAPFLPISEVPEGGQSSTDLHPMNEIYNMIKGGKSVTDFLPFLIQYIHSSSPDGVRTRLTSLRQLLTTLVGIVERRDENVVGFLFALYRFGFIYKKLVWLKGEGMKPQQFYEVTRRFLSFGFVRKLSKQEKYHNALLRRIYLKRKGRPAWEPVSRDRNFEKMVVYAPTEQFHDFLTLVFDQLKVRPPKWAVKLVSDYAQVLNAPEDPKEVIHTEALESLQEMLPQIADTWLNFRAYGPRSKYAEAWRQYLSLAERYGIPTKEFVDMVRSYARNELGADV